MPCGRHESNSLAFVALPKLPRSASLRHRSTAFFSSVKTRGALIPGLLGWPSVRKAFEGMFCTFIHSGVSVYRTWLFWSYSGVPVYRTWLFWSYSGGYPGTEPGCFGHTRVGTRVPNLVVLVIFKSVPGCESWLLWSYLSRYWGTKPGCFGHTRVGTRVPNLGCFRHTRVGARVPNRVVLVILG